MYKQNLTLNVISGVDLIPLAATFVACLLLGLDYGMLIGIGVNLMFILYNSARPKVQVRNLTVSNLLVHHMLHWLSKNK
jgi:sodium-independent sulfate anion transporter 11